ncbi:polysaccharide biosynthesis protein GtrA [Sphingomonas oleivorans]|uniref:Polysaccharide biosynthesis protein GtrA n=2 Tax=Sphingomonas oleivorans TaxID=1735121 RepID=A0A2T5G2T8_9SPHN|nr:polysaccharide biosynthesis protein GtrA [Sphingomonas oleivorans]
MIGGGNAARREMLAQFIRYGLTGGFVTGVYALVYAAMVQALHVAPLIANVAGYAVAVVLGYVLHSRWSFRGHGRRDNVARTGGKFVAVSLLSFGLNSLWVWLITGLLHLPPLLPLIPIATVTPVIVFWLNRVWVFD